ncbi:hypothetical protein QHH11_27195 [Aphanizomenon sp. PH219]|nr:hypothetical protein [Aphanizomenon sp. 202]MDK2462759.1 hypothetical protein [Aphanizomenon sp. PH219]
MCGQERTINIRRTGDKLIIDKIEKFRQAKNINEQRPVIIIEGKFNFYDTSLAGTLRKTARNDLDILVENAAERSVVFGLPAVRIIVATNSGWK